MDLYSDSGELYTIRQEFFTGQYKQVSQTELSQFSAEAQPKAQEYILRSKIALKLYDEVLAETEGQEDVTLSTIRAYVLYLTGDAAGEEQLQNLISTQNTQEVVQVLGSIYLVNSGDVSEALSLLSKHQNSLECISLIVQLKAFDHPEESVKELKSCKKWSQDDIIYNLAESWINSTLDHDKIQSSFYFYEEISSSNLSLRNLVGLLVLNLQLHHLPESEDIINQANSFLEEVSGLNKEELLANQITYNILTGGDKEEELRQELTALNKNHPAIVDYQEKVSLFDDIVAKYAELQT